jgi:DNA-binding transcriptional LysR family regulator
MDLISLRDTLTVREQTSFRRAGSALGIHASAVLRRVEDELGVSLFERHVRGVRTTIAGRHFLDRTRSALAELDHAVRTAGNAGRGNVGDLRIGIFSSIASQFIREVLAAYTQQHPLVEIDVAEGAPSDHIRLVREGRLDIAFAIGLPDEPPCDSVPRGRKAGMAVARRRGRHVAVRRNSRRTSSIMPAVIVEGEGRAQVDRSLGVDPATLRRLLMKGCKPTV